MNTKHTPGPWGIEQTGNTNWIGPLRPDGKIKSCIVYSAREELRPEVLERVDANARLIAAAPDLLDALRNVLLSCPADADSTPRFNAAWNEATKAIRKAQGEGNE